MVKEKALLNKAAKMNAAISRRLNPKLFLELGNMQREDLKQFILRYNHYHHGARGPKPLVDQETGLLVQYEYSLYPRGGRGFIDLVAVNSKAWPVIAIEYDSSLSSFKHCRSPQSKKRR